MGNIIGRLKQGDLTVEGIIDERQPPITNGLIAHYPLDGTPDTASLWGSGFANKVVADSTIHDMQGSAYPLQPGQTLRYTGWFKKSSDWVGSFWFYAYQQHTPSGGTASWAWINIHFDTSFPANEWTYCEGTYTLGYSGETITSQTQGISVRNDATAGTLEWKDCHCYVSNSGSDSSVTYLNDGAAVEAATANLVVKKGWTTEGTQNPSKLPLGCPVTPVISSYVPKGDYLDLFNVNIAQTLAMNDTMVVSGWFYVKGIAGGFNCQLNDTNNANRGIGTVYLSQGWNYLWWRYTNTTGADITVNSARVEATYTGDSTWRNGDNEAWGCNYQVEWRKNYPTAFANGDRIDSSSLSFPKNSLTSTGSLHFEVYIDNYSAQNPIFSTGIDGGFDLLTSTGATSGGSNYWRMFSSSTVSVQQTGYWFPNLNKWYSVAVTWTNSGAANLYVNGVVVSSTANCGDWFTYYNGNANTKFYLGSGIRYVTSLKFRNLSFYNRVLSGNEVTRLARSSLSVTKSGDIKALVIENPNDMDNHSAYFPLGVDNSSDTLSISASTENNVVYENSTVWIGNSVTNMIYDQSNFSAGSCTAAYDSIKKEWTITVASGSTDSWRGISYNRTDAVATPGTTHTISWEVYSDGTYPIYMDVNNFGVTTSTGTNDNDIVANRIYRTGNTMPGKWIKMSVTYNFDSSATQNFYMQNKIILNNGYTPSGDAIIKIRNIQQESGSFSTPFVNGTRNAGLLKYPLTFAPNMSFSFWHKLIQDGSTIVNQSTSPNIFEIGDYYANSSFTLWYWGNGNLRIYARQDGATAWTIAGAGLTGAYDQTYWSKWHNYTIVFNGSGSTITGVTVYVDGTSRYTNSSLTITSWSGSFFGMGAYGGMQPNAYYRDLLCVPSVLSNTDVLNLYKNQMRAYKDGSIQVQGQIMEGQVL